MTLIAIGIDVVVLVVAMAAGGGGLVAGEVLDVAEAAYIGTAGLVV